MSNETREPVVITFPFLSEGVPITLEKFTQQVILDTWSVIKDPSLYDEMVNADTDELIDIAGDLAQEYAQQLKEGHDS